MDKWDLVILSYLNIVIYIMVKTLELLGWGEGKLRKWKERAHII